MDVRSMGKGEIPRTSQRYLISNNRCNKVGFSSNYIFFPSFQRYQCCSVDHLLARWGGKTQDGAKGGERWADAEEPHANGPLRKDENKKAGKRSLKKMVLQEGERFY